MIMGDHTQIKCVAVGDPSACKSQALHSFIQEIAVTHAMTTPVPTSAQIDTFTTEWEEEERVVCWRVWNTEGQEDLPRLRTYSYHETDLFLLCFSVVSPASLESVITKWQPEIRRWCPHTPLVLVGTEAQRREDQKTCTRLARAQLRPVSVWEGQACAQLLGALVYVECASPHAPSWASLMDTILSSSSSSSSPSSSHRSVPLPPAPSAPKSSCSIM